MTSITFTPNKQAKEAHVLQRVRKLAEQQNRSMNWIVLKAVLEYLEKHEGEHH